MPEWQVSRGSLCYQSGLAKDVFLEPYGVDRDLSETLPSDCLAHHPLQPVQNVEVPAGNVTLLTDVVLEIVELKRGIAQPGPARNWTVRADWRLVTPTPDSTPVTLYTLDKDRQCSPG